nr:DNA (cytosine-5)-methyltransferase PliMCI-like [Onthophagus taurus]
MSPINDCDDYEDDLNVKKKQCTSHEKKRKNIEKVDIPKDEVKMARCDTCKQYLDAIIPYGGHPNNAADEYVALTDEKLMIFTGEEEEVNEQDSWPTNNITYFAVYDSHGHLCPFDTGLIQQNKHLYFSGYLKPIYDDNPLPDDGIPVKDAGPINEWYIWGFDGGKNSIIGFSTSFGEYNLMTPSPAYQQFMTEVNQKMALTKLVIEFLMDEGWQSPTYEDLLQRLSTTEDLNEEILLQHAQFVCDHVVSFDSSADNDAEDLLITTPCMRALVKIAGVTFQKSKKNPKASSRKISKAITDQIKNNKKPSRSKATTTALVRDVFETFFAEQIDKGTGEKGPRKKRCGICEACQSSDCGKCVFCRSMLKFGGSGKSKQACKTRRCPNMAIQDAAAESENEDDDIDEDTVEDTKVKNIIEEKPCSKRILHKVEWRGEISFENNDRVYYEEAQVGDTIVKPDDFVMLNHSKPNEPLLIAQISYMWKDKRGFGAATFHAHIFTRGVKTVLGETSDPRELFDVDMCENLPLGSIVRKAFVERRFPPVNWFELGGIERLPPILEDDGQNYFYSKRYDATCGRFEDLIEDDDENIDDDEKDFSPCSACRRKMIMLKTTKPCYKEGYISWFGENYKIGTGVYLIPETYDFDSDSEENSNSPKSETKADQDLYTEYYRKTSDFVKKGNSDTPQPFCIGVIENIIENSNAKDIKVEVRKFYRPENTHRGIFVTYQEDLNYLYWSEEKIIVSFDNIAGKCYLTYGDSLEIPVAEWSSLGPDRFYFNKMYDKFSHKILDLPEKVIETQTLRNMPKKGKGKNKSKKVNSQNKCIDDELPKIWPKISKPLQCMDVFAGCGGLSLGLHQSGIALTKWAIEKEIEPAQAFKLNNPDALVFTEDCNELLKGVFDQTEYAKRMPKKGDVEMLVGGPPCQGFSGMNRFNAGQYSRFKNSLVVSYLSYCDYYRPKYFILENVRNFVSHNRSMVLKLTLRCLVAMGYQVTFGIVQAGHYGVPQTRRRLIIMAAAPGYVLPKYPEPRHVFNKRGCLLSIAVDNQRFVNGCQFTSSAPYRMTTVRDAMSDLPDIKNGWNQKEIQYDAEPMSHFQKLMRKGEGDLVRDHICKEMTPLVEARMTYIPLAPGSDWRDLPNIEVRLSDGNYTKKLRYPYRIKKQSKDEPNKGVCQCTTGKGIRCDPADKQSDTLIPWCLPHTGDRHNHWAGLYGRLEWDGFFSTTVTNPEPMGKQGKVLHPDQHRVVSVRECARSQGFPDRYQFVGSVLKKHRQIGNAVPPPLGAALGSEILKALDARDKKKVS